MLTGRDTDEIILFQLNDRDLASICSVDHLAKRFCNRQDFWKRRIVNRYGPEGLPDFTDDYKNFYQSGQVKAYVLCGSIPHSSQLVVEDFYRPLDGFYNKYWTRDVEGITYLLLKIAYSKSRDQKITKLLIRERDNLPEWRLEQFGSSLLEWSDKDGDMFQKIIAVDPGAPQLLRIAARANPALVRAVSPDPIKAFRFIDYIHKGFQTGRLPIDILWSELCSHPYTLAYRVK